MNLEQTERSQASALIWTRNPALRDHLFHMLSIWAEEVCVELSLTCQEPFSGETEPGSILFLDGDGLDEPQPAQLELIRNMALVVVSADKQTAIRAFRWHPAAFLTPHSGYQAIQQAMDQCFSFWQKGLKWLDLPFRRDRVRVPLCQLCCVEADGRETILYCTGGQMRASYPLGRLWGALPSPPFFRCQRGFLVHLGAVERMAGGALILKADHRAIPVSRQQIKTIQQALLQWQAIRKD